MKRITNLNHPKETFLYSISRMLERTSFYGLRALIMLYMTGGILKMTGVEALSVYGWFTVSFVFSKIIGAILGDLIIGNKKAIIIGAFIQSLGAFSICNPSISGLYVGLFLIVIGGGLHTPNIISNFGKLYLNKIELLNAGFTMLYLAVNLGAFFGIVSIGYIGEEYGWNSGFVLAGIIMLFSIIPILFSQDKEIELITEKKLTINKRIINILIAFVIVASFWAIYELGSIRIFDLQTKLSEIPTSNIAESLWTSINSIFILLISISAIVLWSLFYSDQVTKLTFGFLFGIISFGILFLIPEIPTEQHIILYLISLFFLSVSEIHITPIIHSILTQFSNPKYLAILISLIFIPTRLFSVIIGMFNEKLYDNPLLGLKTGMIIMVVVSLGLITYIIFKQKNSQSKS